MQLLSLLSPIAHGSEVWDLEASLCNHEFGSCCLSIYSHFPSNASFDLIGLLDDASNFQLSLWGGELWGHVLWCQFLLSQLAHVQVAAGVQSP